MKRSHQVNYTSSKKQRLNSGSVETSNVTDLNSNIKSINQDFLNQAEANFSNNPVNMMARNAVATVGALNAAVDTDQANKVNHIFLNSIKPEHIRATNQGNSGRCWMFAGLNVFRYLLIKALDLENFEFSETYLFFYDKLERANYTIQYFIDNPEATPDNREASIMLKDYYGDGGYWNYFANLVHKYGLVPKEAMEETFNSGWSEEMNNILQERIISCCNMILKKNKNKERNIEQLKALKRETLDQIYSTLVKFLGQPPKTFTWSFRSVAKVPNCIADLTPKSFHQLVLGSIDVRDFVVLCNIPGKEFYQNYLVRNMNNVIGGDECVVLNVPVEELKKYASTAITKGIPVWFSGDVGKGFGFHKSVLDEEIFNTDLLFGSPYKWNKAEKLQLGFTEGNHAMTLTGVNYDHKGKPTQWQVENSWGYCDHELPGLDGFLSMSDKWFVDNLVQIVVHKNFLSRNLQNHLEKTPIELDPWDYMAPALRIRTKRAPDGGKGFRGKYFGLKKNLI